MRGSSRYARTGCGRSNGFSGQSYDGRALNVRAGSETTFVGAAYGVTSPPAGSQGQASDADGTGPAPNAAGLVAEPAWKTAETSNSTMMSRLIDIVCLLLPSL